MKTNTNNQQDTCNEELDIAGKPIHSLTTFQAIRNLFKGLFWGTYFVSEKIDFLKKTNQETISIPTKDLITLLSRIEASFLAWDKFTIKIVNDFLATADKDTRDKLTQQIAHCQVTTAVKKAFNTIPEDLPAIPVHVLEPKQSEPLFPKGGFNQKAYLRKYNYFENALKDFEKIYQKNKTAMQKTFQESAVKILDLNKDENY